LTRRDDLRDTGEAGSKIRVDNLHWELSEEDLKELFGRIGPVQTVQIEYDRQDRSTGVAYITYPDSRDARAAIQEFDGANANGQPIRLTLIPNGPAARPRNPFDTVERPSRSLFDRIDHSERRRRAPATDSDSSPPPRRSNVAKPAPDNIDRYVPGQNSSASRRRSSPHRNDSDRGGRRPGQRRERAPRERGPRKDAEGHEIVGGRPRKTQEELDAEMADYWGGDGAGAEDHAAQNDSHAAQNDPPVANLDGDVDMDI